MHLINYDYQTAGAYAITICAHNRQDHPFSIMVVEAILKEEWNYLPQHFAGITPDLIVTMPDHLHVIIWHRGRVENTKSIIDVIDGYKSFCSNARLRHIKATNADYTGPLWQRDFYDHIIRNEKDLNAQRTYMLNNPLAATLKQGQMKIERACEYNSCGHIPFPPEGAMDPT
jgi:REP element-mobilizing transposase RayT